MRVFYVRQYAKKQFDGAFVYVVYVVRYCVHIKQKNIVFLRVFWHLDLHHSTYILHFFLSFSSLASFRLLLVRIRFSLVVEKTRTHDTPLLEKEKRKKYYNKESCA